MELRKATPDELGKIFLEMEKNFPPEERRDTDEAKAVTQNEKYSIYLAFDDECQIGFITVWELSNFAFIEHFVTYEEYRSKGYGTLVLEELKRTHGMLVLEVEPPEDGLKQRRICFYQRAGFRQNPFPYIQPPYRASDSGTRLILMSCPSEISDERAIVSEIYKTVYKKDFI